MMRYQIELDLSFLPEPITDEERKIVTEKGACRFDRFDKSRLTGRYRIGRPTGRGNHPLFGFANQLKSAITRYRAAKPRDWVGRQSKPWDTLTRPTVT